jgi:hypothetical protein
MDDITHVTLTDEQRFHLARLRRFAAVAVGETTCLVPALDHLARHATLSAYRDCLALGLERQARTVLTETIGQVETH